MNTNNKEIERKWLVRNEAFKAEATSQARIRQGYLSMAPYATVRVRQYGDAYYMTIKGRPKAGEIGRVEWEREITQEDFEVLFALSSGGAIDKVRYIVPLKGTKETTGADTELKIEVDVFEGENAGLVMAEIEMPTEGYVLPELPEWIGEEVTHDHRYYNSYLTEKPFGKW